MWKRLKGGRGAAAEGTGLSWLEDTREQKGSTHPPEKQQGDCFGPASSLKVKNTLAPRPGHAGSSFPMMLLVHNGH